MFDVCVIGSGPAGGVLSKELAEAGAKVVLLEAGRVARPDEYHYHAWPYEFANRKKPTPGYPPEVTSALRYENSDKIFVDRIRVVGGRSIHWNANCFRFSERDFRARSMEGVEEDWPISYQELAPYYSYVEKMIGVTGTREGLDVLPDGEYLRPLKLRCSEHIVGRACRKMGIRLIPTRKAVLTEPYDGRPPVPLLRGLHGRMRYWGHIQRAKLHASESAPDRKLHVDAEQAGARIVDRRGRQSARRIGDRYGHPQRRGSASALFRGVLRDHRVRATAAQFPISPASQRPGQLQ